MAPYRPNRKNRRSKKYKKLMSEQNTNNESVQKPDVNLGDMDAMLRIIDVASKRGAFEGAELSSVGLVRDRIAAFVDFHTPKKEEADTKETPAEETTDGAEATEETSE